MAKGGGGFTYLVNILPVLSRLAPDAEFLVTVADDRVGEANTGLPNVEVRHLGALGALGRLRFTYWQASRLAREWGADLYFSAGETAPLDAPCPTIAAFRNLNVFTWLAGQGLPWRQKARIWALYGMAVASALRCDRVMFVSEDSARWIGDSMRIPRERRRVVHHGIDLASWSPVKPPRHGPGCILSVSSIYTYKNYVRLIEAYGELARRRAEVPRLVIVGDDQDPDYSRRMSQAREATGVAERIEIVGAVPYAQVRRYYAEAGLFVFPSWLESFGHPLLEAMASGIPVVAADIPVFREIGGEAVLYADPRDSVALANAMETLLAHPDRAAGLVERGLARVKEFSWQRSGEGLLALFEELL